MEAQVPTTADFIVRPYESADREAVRDLCCRTGFLGKPIDPVFEDRDLFANFLTDYYLRCEPESSFVVTIDDTIKGYLLGCRFPRRHQLFSIRQSVSLAAKARIPGGLPVFTEVGPNVTPEDVLARHGLKRGPRRDLDRAAGVSVTTWQR